MSAEAALHPGGDTRRRIVEMAERLFREMGYRKTTVADIARALRMSPANVYRFFASKSAINEAVAERLTAEVQARLEAVARGQGPAASRMRDLLLTLNRCVRELGGADLKMQEMVEAAMNESWNVIRAHIDRVDAIVAGLLREGAAAGEFAVADPDGTAACIRAAMLRFCHPQLLAQCEAVPRPTVEQQVDFIMAALGARPADAGRFC
jgi:AcrR family transcriptional regulator